MIKCKNNMLIDTSTGLTIHVDCIIPNVRLKDLAWFLSELAKQRIQAEDTDFSYIVINGWGGTNNAMG